MNQCIMLIKVDFDSMDNHNPRIEEYVGVFFESNGLTAYGNASKYFEQLPPEKRYLGYDEQVYPQYILRSINVLNKSQEQK